MTDVELVVTDLDGTLWSGHEETHPSTADAWRQLERRGIPVLVATGRRLTSTRDPLARLGFAPPAVVMNGALVLDLDTGARYHEHFYDADAARVVLDAFRAVGVEPCVYVDHPTVDVFIGERPSTHPLHLRGLGATAEQADLEHIVGTVPVLMFGIIGVDDPEPLVSLRSALTESAEAHLAGSDQYGGHSFTVSPQGLSKWVGVMAYCNHAGIDPTRVLAIGDGPNDIELLTAASVAVVPSNACAEALAVADHTVASPRDGGWAQLLDLV